MGPEGRTPLLRPLHRPAPPYAGRASAGEAPRPLLALLRRASRASGRPAGGCPSPGGGCVGLFRPAPPAFALVHALKYEGLVELAPWLGAHLAAAARRGLGGLGRAVLVPIPLHPRRLAERGFNQSLLLARVVGRRLGLEVGEEFLERRRDTRPQAQLPLEERAANVAEAFARRTPLPEGRRVLLVDDVVTTGATARAARAALGCEAPILAVVRARDAAPGT